MKAVFAGLILLWPLCAAAQLGEENATQQLDLQHRALSLKRRFELTGFKERYAYQIACFSRLLPLEATLRRCVEAQRIASGEFHGRLDLDIEPGGKLEHFAARGHDQLQACLMPHLLGLRFPAFTGGSGEGTQPFQLQVLVASPGVQLGRPVPPTPVAVYPVSSDEERKSYHQAVGWVFSPWAQAVDFCAELADQQFGFGYRMMIEVGVKPSGRPARAQLELRGKLARRAIAGLADCVTPFIRAMAAPAHGGTDLFRYRFGASTAGWGIR